ncbi:MAG: RdgB/HAM1 family non-canonical purine NTP pyrophosphatase [Bdellovibrio sp.]|nr:MAG: RdgB/HAM1 family non-canonical purine NTP pyrophosphatase [Bdellovibrio sp.]
MEIWLATFNEGKLREFKSLMAGSPFTQFHTAKELSYYSAPEETGNSFLENARIKARSFQAIKPGVWVVGEDSGLEVMGLNMMPGIHSSRYAGSHASDIENNLKLLKMMSLRSAHHREAQFRCSLVALDPSGREHHFEGTLKGQIAKKMKGQEGFGYDSLFIPENEEKTLAELGLAFKNKISHRSQAIKKFLKFINSYYEQK